MKIHKFKAKLNKKQKMIRLRKINLAQPKYL